MPFAYELAWTDTNYDSLKRTVNHYERAYNTHQETLAQHETELQDLQTWHQLVDNTLTEIGVDQCPHGARFVADVRATINERVSLAIGQINHHRNCTNQIVTSLTETRERLRRYPPSFQGEHRVTKADLTRALTGLPNLKPGSIATGYLPYNIPFIRWVFTGILMRPDKNHYAWLRGLGAGNTPSFPLQDVQVEIHLTDGAVKLSPLRGQRGQAPFTWDNQNRVHPHILSNDEPCLGDFAGPFREALHELDWVSVYTYLRLFLERAINSDAAGAKWVQPFTTALPMLNLIYHADVAYPVGQPDHGCCIVETTPGCYELQIRDSHSFPGGNLISTKPLELRDRFFKEAPTV